MEESESTRLTLISEQREGESLTEEARQIVYRHETGFGRLGVICRQVQDDELWAYIEIDGHPCGSFSQWMKHVGSKSESYCWAALQASRQLIDLKDSDLSEIGHDNVQTLRLLPESIRKSSEVTTAARQMAPDAFLDKMRADHPNLHLERRKTIKLPEGAASRIEDAMKAAELHGAVGRTAQLQAIAEAALDYWEMIDMQERIARGDVQVQ